MTAVVLARPPLVTAPAPPPAPPFHRARMRWDGWDGSRWDLTDYRSGVVVTQNGVAGLHHPALQDYTSTAAGVHGQRKRGKSRAQARVVQWPIYMWAGSSDEFVALEDAWWRSFSPDEYGMWTVTTPNGGSRTLKCRLQSDGGFTHDRDPIVFGWCAYTVDLVADDPFWYGDAVTAGWGNPGSETFIDPDGSPPFHIVANSTTGGATLTNPGDVDAWPVWTITGPVTSGTLSIGDGELGLPAVADGSVLTVDTDPDSGRVRLDGVKAMSSMTAWDPRPVPVGGSTPVGIDIVGTGDWKVDVELRPRFWRAW